MIQNDPRTHLIVLLAMGILVLFNESQWQIYSMLVFSMVYMLLHGAWKQAIHAVVTYVLLRMLLLVMPIVMPGLAPVVFSVTQIYPVFMIGFVFTASNGSRILYALDALRLPKPFLIVTMIFLRFFHLLLKEIQTIYEGIRVRGIFPTPFHLIRHPFVAYECLVVPLTFRCLKLSSELAVAAEIRGIECQQQRTTVAKTNFSVNDVLTVLVLLALSLWIMVGDFSD